MIAIATTLLVTGGAGAVIGGQTDTSNIYSNVGMFEMRFDGEWFPNICTGTLVDENVVLTAAHCMDFVIGAGGLGVENVRITFDPTPGEDSTRFGITSAVVHPDWLATPPLRGNSKKWGLGPGNEDVALVWLTASPSGLTPAPIVAEGDLDDLDLTSETFDVVGYGVTEFVTGSAMSPKALALAADRNYKEVSIITEHEAFADRYVKITASTCFGDSGGPLFHDGTVVAVNTWTSSMRCSAPSFSYRLDTELAQTFLNTYLD